MSNRARAFQFMQKKTAWQRTEVQRQLASETEVLQQREDEKEVVLQRLYEVEARFQKTMDSEFLDPSAMQQITAWYQLQQQECDVAQNKISEQVKVTDQIRDELISVKQKENKLERKVDEALKEQEQERVALHLTEMDDQYLMKLNYDKSKKG